AAPDGTRHRRDLLAATAADLVAEHAAHYGADHRARDVVRVAGRRLMRDLLVVTRLPGCTDGLRDWGHRENLRIVVLAQVLVASEGAPRRGHDRADDQPSNQ